MKNLIIGNAAGMAKNMLDVERLCRSGATRITVGSITLNERDGNLGKTYYYDERTGASLNSLGLPNFGMEKYKKLLPEMVTRAKDSGKEFVVSVAGFSTKEFGELAAECAEAGVKRVELNLGCPNVHGKEGRKPIFSYTPELVEESLFHTQANVGRDVTIGVKISPIDDQPLLLRVANALTRSGIVREVVACNTIPDKSIALPSGEEALTFQAEKGGSTLHRGGLAGEPLRTRTLWVVESLRSMMLRSVCIIAAGGIKSGEHMRTALDSGANGIECATAYMQHGPRIFSDIVQEYYSAEEEPA